MILTRKAISNMRGENKINAKIAPARSTIRFSTWFQPVIGLCTSVTRGIPANDSTSVWSVRKLPRSGTIRTSTHCSESKSFNSSSRCCSLRERLINTWSIRCCWMICGSCSRLPRNFEPGFSEDCSANEILPER